MTAAELVQRLIRFETTNPPGAERACIAWIDELLQDAGIETTIVADDPERPNLVARLPGAGDAPPLLLQGHVDVVPATGQRWSRDPFSGELADGWIWGRGALDMKGGVGMMLHALLRASSSGMTPAGDLVLAVLSDEEAGGVHGARVLVRERPELLAGIRYAIGEFGAFSTSVGGRRFYPIQVTEKQVCAVRATFSGPAGHGSMPVRGGAMAKLGAFLRAVDRRRLPVHVTPVVRRMVDDIAAGLPAPAGAVLRRLRDPRTAGAALRLLGSRARLFAPLLHNTVSPTVLDGGGSRNVIPARVAVDLDGRILPGLGPDDLLRELRALAGSDADLEVLRFEPGPPEPDLGLFGLLRDVLREADPQGTPVPMLLPAITDARHFGRLGIQGYGFTPLRLPRDFAFADTIHAADERVPVAALEFGAEAMFRVLERYRGGNGPPARGRAAAGR